MAQVNRGGWPQRDAVMRRARSRSAGESHAGAARAPPDEGLVHRSPRHPAGHRGPDKPPQPPLCAPEGEFAWFARL